MPQLARVVGKVWAPAKYPDLDGASLLMLQRLGPDDRLVGEPFAAADVLGAGEGETVFYITAYEAVIPYRKPLVPLDATIVGIVDHIERDDRFYPERTP